MADLKILRVDKGDSQKNLVDKLNANFANTLAFGGGPLGKTGTSGVMGDQGPIGPIGSYGNQGQRGSIWSVSPNQPPSSSSLAGDFWIDVLNYNKIYKYSGSSWDLYNLNLTDQDIFIPYGPLTSTSNYIGYFNSARNPGDYTLALSDSTFSPAGASNLTFNPQSSKIVISTNAGIAQRRILEFSKTDYLESSYTRFPSFNWIIGPTSGKESWETGSVDDNGQYGVALKSPDGFNVDTTSSFNVLTSRDFYSYSNGISINTSSSSPLTFNPRGIFSLSTGNEPIRMSTSNISTSSNGEIITSNVRFRYRNNYDSTKSASAFRISSSFQNTSNLIISNSQAPSRTSTLLHIRDIPYSQDILKVFSNGDLYYLRRFDAIQNTSFVNNASTGNVLMSGRQGVTGTTTQVYWLYVIPGVNTPGTSLGLNALYGNSGIDYIVDPVNYGPSGPSAPNVNLGIALWNVPNSSNTTIGANNRGWVNLLNDSEAITIRVRMKDPNKTFRFVGLAVTNPTITAPNGNLRTGVTLDQYGNGQVNVLSSDPSRGANTVEFTILNLSSGATRTSSQRWYKVYYSAYGGNLVAGASSSNQISDSNIPNYAVSGVLWLYGSTVGF